MLLPVTKARQICLRDSFLMRVTSSWIASAMRSTRSLAAITEVTVRFDGAGPYNELQFCQEINETFVTSEDLLAAFGLVVIYDSRGRQRVALIATRISSRLDTLMLPLASKGHAEIAPHQLPSLV